jgi:hypothetical protein
MLDFIASCTRESWTGGDEGILGTAAIAVIPVNEHTVTNGYGSTYGSTICNHYVLVLFFVPQMPLIMHGWQLQGFRWSVLQ